MRCSRIYNCALSSFLENNWPNVFFKFCVGNNSECVRYMAYKSSSECCKDAEFPAYILPTGQFRGWESISSNVFKEMSEIIKLHR